MNDRQKLEDERRERFRKLREIQDRKLRKEPETMAKEKPDKSWDWVSGAFAFVVIAFVIGIGFFVYNQVVYSMEYDTAPFVTNETIDVLDDYNDLFALLIALVPMIVVLTMILAFLRSI